MVFVTLTAPSFGSVHRQITYTAVKHRITALRAGLDARPTVSSEAGIVVT